MKYGEHKNGFFLPNELFQLDWTMASWQCTVS